MPAPKLCPKCQRPVDGNAPHELCPACLLEAMMHEGAAEKPGEQPRPTVKLDLTAPLTEQPGDRIGRYKLREMVGEGGFGVVYVAEQEKPVRRLVALKVIKLGMDTREVIARFEAERQALALMDHPNIAKVLDAGATDAGRPYFVMELVKGIPITTFCDQHNLTTDDRLGLFTQVCHAIQHAHQKGIIHRDIKPSNILVTSHDGVPVPKVIDFGIAKATQGRLTDLTVYTEMNQFMGTPAYMSPEQAELSGLDIDTRTDIYALGVLLYQLLTGKTPFDPKKLVEAGLDEIRRTIREVEPPKPSTRVSAMDAADQTTVAKHRQTESGKLTSLLRGDLDWIVMKCLEKDRTRRYDTANGLAADLKRHLTNEPVIARPPSAAYRLQKAVRRNKLAFTAASAVAAALVIGIISSSWLYFRESKARQRAVTAEVAQGRLFTEAQTARTNEMRLRQQQRERLVRVNVASGLKSQEQGDLLSALPRYVEALKLDQGRPKEEHIHRLRIAGVLDQSPKLVRMWFHDGPVLQAEFSHNGRLVLTTDKDGTARVWSLTNETAIAIVRHRGPVLHAAFSPDDGHIATASADGTARIWATATGAPVTPPLGHTATVNRVSFSPDGRRLLTASDDFTARIWNATNGTEVFPPLGHGGEVRDAAFSPDGQYFATLNQDTAHNTNYAMRLWRAETAEEVDRFRFGDFAAFSVNFSSDGRYLVGSALSHVQVVSVAAKRTIARMNPGLDVYKAVFSEDGDFVLSGGANSSSRSS